MSPVLHAHLAGAPLALTGTGRPDTPPTLPSDLVQAVRTAPVGSTYVSTDGTGVGAWVWRRRPTGWVVVDGDTGWRDITTWARSVSPSLALAGYQLRLCGGRIDLRWKGVSWTAIDDDSLRGRLPVPSEIAALILSKVGVDRSWTDYTVGSSSGANLHAYITSAGLSWVLTTARSAHLSVPLPAGAWPATLPGVPA